MSIMNLFRRTEKKVNDYLNYHDDRIICNDASILKRINEWTKNEGLSFTKFADFMEQIGFKMPITIVELEKKSKSRYKFITADGKSFGFRLRVGDCFDNLSQINIISDNYTKFYSIYNNRREEPRIQLESMQVICKDKVIGFLFSDFSYSCTINFYENNSTLSIEIDYLFNKSNSKLLSLKESDYIENYILNLTSDVKINEVFDAFMCYLNMSDEEKMNFNLINFSYSFIDSIAQINKFNIVIKNGQLEEYSLCENNDHFYLLKSGDWKYVSSNGVSISYFSQGKQYNMSVSGNANSILELDYNSIFNFAQSRIKEMMEKYF